MGIFSWLFGSGSKKVELIRQLATKRISRSPIPLPQKPSSLPTIQLMGLPEATAITIAESYFGLTQRGVSELEALIAIEAHRSSLGDKGELPRPLSLLSYISYRLKLECDSPLQMNSAEIQEAIGYGASLAGVKLVSNA